MRTLDRNKRTLYYALQTGTESVLDGEGFDTGERNAVYADPVAYKLHIGKESGTTTLEQYGSQIPYTRTLITDDMNCPITEQTVLWIDVPTTEPYNYVVTCVSISLNHVLITAKRVTYEN